MSTFTNPISNEGTSRASRAGLILSISLHVLVCLLLFFGYQRTTSSQIVAAGEGEGGEGGGGSIEVGVSDASALFGFAKPQPAAFIGDDDSPINNARVETNKAESANEEALLPPTEKTESNPDAVKTDRPVVPREERVFTGKDERGRSQSQSTQVGSSYGSPTPAAFRGGVGLGSGSGSGGGTGLPGGSAYGRLIQSILSRNYNPPSIESGNPQFVVILLRISREGKILSISNGRVSASHIKQRSALDLVNKAAERAIIASDPLPAFPAGFLSGADVAVAEVIFRYPK